ncbi:MAG: DUF2461 domain-containing protein [Clostridiales bacterium]|nr:DUF2461 domain-containing protein [Clostridiales bacterium]
MFQGLNEDTYQFFWEIAFNNEQSFYEANKDRYKKNVYEPLKQLTMEITPAAQEIDPEFNIRPSSVISRLRRDTRYSHDKTMYRDHAWLGFRRPGGMLSESFVVYAEFEREGYGYGMGMYGSNPALMREIRPRILARPQKFLTLVNDPAFAKRFTAMGDEFKRPRFTDAPEGVLPYLNRKGLSFCFSSPNLKNTLSPQIRDEIIEGFNLLKPVYRFMMGLD